MSQLNILFLKNIFLKNFNQPEELMFQRMLEDLLPAADKTEVAAEVAAEDSLMETMSSCMLGDIPPVYTSIKNWPSRSNLLCWHCNMKVAGVPVAIPIDLKKNNTGGIEMKVVGVFCSFPCAKSYINIHYPKNDLSSGWADKNNFLRLMFKDFHNIEPDVIPAAPSPYIMSKYCGKTNNNAASIDEEEYRRRIKELEQSMFNISNTSSYYSR